MNNNSVNFSPKNSFPKNFKSETETKDTSGTYISKRLKCNQRNISRIPSFQVTHDSSGIFEFDASTIEASIKALQSRSISAKANNPNQLSTRSVDQVKNQNSIVSPLLAACEARRMESLSKFEESIYQRTVEAQLKDLSLSEHDNLISANKPSKQDVCKIFSATQVMPSTYPNPIEMMHSEPEIKPYVWSEPTIVHLLQHHMLDINGTFVGGVSALYWAVREEKIELIERLLNAGARGSVLNRGIEDTPLSLAERSRNLSIRKLFKLDAPTKGSNVLSIELPIVVETASDLIFEVSDT